MRIAHIITRLIVGGAQENTILNCEDLVRDFRDEVLLITGPALGPEGTLFDRISQRVEWEQPEAVVQRYCHRVIPGAVPAVLVPTMQRAISPWHDFWAWHSIQKILREFRPDVVHTHSAKAGILGRFAATALGVPAVIHTVHGAPFYRWQNRLVARFYRECEAVAAKRCDAIISVADAMTTLMTDAKVAPPSMFSTIYSGMEVETFLQSARLREETRQKYGLRRDDIVVGKIARLFPLKGHEYLIEAAKTVVQRVPAVRFMLVGDGILSERFQKKIAKAGLEKHFILTGLIPPADMPAIFSAVDIVVHTGLREGLARVLPQGLLSGKPVISYDVDGAKEVVFDGKTGFLLPPKEVPLLTQRIIELAENESLRQKMGENGRELCRNRFDHREMTRQIRQLYTTILKQKGNPNE